MSNIVSELALENQWILAAGFHNTFTITCTDSNGAPFPTTAYTPTLEIFKVGDPITSTPVRSLGVGTGITNGGATGVLTIALTSAYSVLLTQGEYFWHLKMVHPDGFTYRWLKGTARAQIQDLSGDTFSELEFPLSLNGTNIYLSISLPGSSGTGDVVGPGSATDGAIVLFNGTTGKIVKNSVYTPASFDPAGSAAAAIVTLRNSVPSAGDDLNKLYNLIVAVGQLVGDFDASSGAVPTTGTGLSGSIDKGDTWRITVAGTITGLTPITTVKSGDMIVAKVAGASSGSQFFAVEANADQATSSVLGLVKLYTDVGASNTDGPVSQAALVTGLALKEATANKDATGGYAGLTLFKINFKNAINTFTSFFTNSNTAARTYTFQDRNGTISDDTDLALKVPTTRTINGNALSANLQLASAGNSILSGRPFSNNLTVDTVTTHVLAANTIRAYRLIVEEACSVNLATIQVTANVAATTMRLGIYTDSSGYPGTKITNSDGGSGVTLSTASIAIVSQPLSPVAVLPAGRYWIVINSNGAATLQAHARYCTLGLAINNASLAAVAYMGYSASLAYADLPSTFPAGASLINTPVSPIITWVPV